MKAGPRAVDRLWAAALLIVLFVPIPAWSQFFGAQSTLFDSSVRLSGMGRTGTAVFWGNDRNDWSNPALLAYNEGLRYERSRTQFVPDLADNVFLTSNRLVFGAWGIGVALAGRPIDGFGGTELDYGRSEATDEEGNVIGEFETAAPSC